MMCYDSLAEDDAHSRPSSLTKSLTQDPRYPVGVPQPFSVDQQITVALPSSPMPIEEDEEGDFGPARDAF